MTEAITSDTVKQAIKEAVVEALNENRDLFRDAVAEALEDLALVKAIQDGEETEQIRRDVIFEVLEAGR